MTLVRRQPVGQGGWTGNPPHPLGFWLPEGTSLGSTWPRSEGHTHEHRVALHASVGPKVSATRLGIFKPI